MVEIKNIHGKVVCRSKNLRGIREWAGRCTPTLVAIDQAPQGEGRLFIRLETNLTTFTCQTTFASFQVLKQTVRNWRNLQKATLVVNGTELGYVSPKNPALN